MGRAEFEKLPDEVVVEQVRGMTGDLFEGSLPDGQQGDLEDMLVELGNRAEAGLSTVLDSTGPSWGLVGERLRNLADRWVG